MQTEIRTRTTLGGITYITGPAGVIVAGTDATWTEPGRCYTASIARVTAVREDGTVEAVVGRMTYRADTPPPARRPAPATAKTPAKRAPRRAPRRSRQEYADYLEDVTGDPYAAEAVRTGR